VKPPTKTIKIDDDTHQRLKEAAVRAKQHMYEVLFRLVKENLNRSRTNHHSRAGGKGVGGG
jgi:predicted CopG family antitoxin